MRGLKVSLEGEKKNHLEKGRGISRKTLSQGALILF